MTIKSVSLSSLETSRANLRKGVDRAGIEGLAASIRADGLLQNLVVKPAGGKDKRLRIVSGERRFRALKLLAQRGEIDADHPVPVEVREELSGDDCLQIGIFRAEK